MKKKIILEKFQSCRKNMNRVLPDPDTFTHCHVEIAIFALYWSHLCVRLPHLSCIAFDP